MTPLIVAFIAYSVVVFLLGDAFGSKRGHATGFKKGQEAGRIYERQGMADRPNKKLTIVGDDGAA